MSNKNSRYLNGLVSFINDTKPFHTKLTEIQEVYQFEDHMTVNFSEVNKTRILLNSFWMYEYYSSGVSRNSQGLGFSNKIHQLISPQFRAPQDSSFVAGRDETNSLTTIKYAFDSTNYGINDVIIKRANRIVNTHQGLDYHRSKGAHVIKIHQTKTVGFSQFCGSEILDFPETDSFPIFSTIDITGATNIRVRSGDAIQTSFNQIKILGPGRIVVDGFVNDSYHPLISEKQDENVMAEATAEAQRLAMDKTDPKSAYNRIKAILTAIGAQLLITPNTSARNALNALLVELEKKIPSSFEAMITYLKNANIPVIAGFVNWRGADTTNPYTDKYVENELYALSPNIVANHFTDIGQRQYAGIYYNDVKNSSFKVFNIYCNPYSQNYEEWVLTPLDADTIGIKGSVSGVIGSINVGDNFVSDLISFKTQKVAGKLTVGDAITIAPENQIVVHHNAPLEEWSIIKTAPFGYNRPVMGSTRYAYIQNDLKQVGYISLFDGAYQSGTLVLTYVSALKKFRVSHTTDTTVSGLAQPNVRYFDGRIAFTIKTGSKFPLVDGDSFYIDIENIPPKAKGLDIFYSYDFDGYDAFASIYNNVDDPYKQFMAKIEFGFDGATGFDNQPYDGLATNPNADTTTLIEDFLKKIEFGYDSRFIGYDFSTFNIQFTENSVDKRYWRLRALPDMARPLKMHNQTPSNKFNLIGTIDPSDPNAGFRFDMENTVDDTGIKSSNDPDSTTDLFLWYASTFALEYYNESTSTWINVDNNVPIGDVYTNPTHGFSFKLVKPNKDFIGAQLHSSWYSTSTQSYNTEISYGGDLITWTTENPFPIQKEASSLDNQSVPRMLIHSDSFHSTDDYEWKMKFTSPTTYTIEGYGFGVNDTKTFFGTLKTVDFNKESFSFKNDAASIHFTFIPNEYGFDKGDVVTLKTFKNRPSYLVHGSVSGWQTPAEYNKYYWNGKIGFKISAPSYTLYANSTQMKQVGTNAWSNMDGVYKVLWSRDDLVDTIYGLDYSDEAKWTLNRNGVCVARGDTILDDGFIRIQVPEEKTAFESISLEVMSDDFNYALGQDLILMKSKPYSFRQVKNDDVLIVQRTRMDELYVHLSKNNRELRTTPIAIGFSDLLTRQEPNYPLDLYSPEIKYYSNWMPVKLDKFDIGTSPAEYSDRTKDINVRSISTGELFGKIEQSATNFDDAYLRIEPEFHDKYLPLNSSVNLLSSHGGFHELATVNLSEKIRFFISGSNGIDALFNESMRVALTDKLPYPQISIKALHDGVVDVSASDTNFQGFMPGYDNLLYDQELSNVDINSTSGYYDAGAPLLDYFQQAQSLELLPSRTPEQERILVVLKSIISPWTNNVHITTINEFLEKLSATPPSGEYMELVNFKLTNDFGIPNEGHGIAVTDRENTVAGARIVENFSTERKVIGGTFGADSFGGIFDGINVSEKMFLIQSNRLTESGSSYSSYRAQLEVENVGDMVINASTDFTKKPIVKVWINGASAPRKIPYTMVNSRTIKLSVQKSAKIKILLA